MRGQRMRRLAKNMKLNKNREVCKFFLIVVILIIIPFPAGFWHLSRRLTDGCQSFAEPVLSTLLYNQKVPQYRII